MHALQEPLATVSPVATYQEQRGQAAQRRRVCRRESVAATARGDRDATRRLAEEDKALTAEIQRLDALLPIARQAEYASEEQERRAYIQRAFHQALECATDATEIATELDRVLDAAVDCIARVEAQVLASTNHV